MGNTKKQRPIRLTNKTAIGLRKAAQRVRSAWLIAMGLATMLFTVAAVTLGFSWLPAVPLTLLLGGVVIVLMMVISRSQYLLLVSQAICTEAASRQMEEWRTEQKRRERAIEQLAAMRADVREAQQKGVPLSAVRGEESLLFDLLTGRDAGEEQAARFDQEDEELYGASYVAEAREQDEEEDLYPQKKGKMPQEAKHSAGAMTGTTKPVRGTAVQSVPAYSRTAAQESASPRRRRRSAPGATAPLQLIRNDQAQ